MLLSQKSVSSRRVIGLDYARLDLFKKVLPDKAVFVSFALFSILADGCQCKKHQDGNQRNRHYLEWLYKPREVPPNPPNPPQPPNGGGSGGVEVETVESDEEPNPVVPPVPPAPTSRYRATMDALSQDLTFVFCHHMRIFVGSINSTERH